jgi:hypothetical protein
VEVGVADAGGDDANERLPLARLVELKGLDGERDPDPT